MKLEVRHAIGELARFRDPTAAVVHAVDVVLNELVKHQPAWDTLFITVRLDDTFPDQHFVTAVALEA